MSYRSNSRPRRILHAFIALLILATSASRPAQTPEPIHAAIPQTRVYLPLVAAPADHTPPPQLPSDQALIEQAFQAGLIDYGASLLYRAYALFADPRLPPEYQGSGSLGEDAALWSEATDPSLPADVRATLHPFIVRPDHPDSVYNAVKTPSVAARAQSALACGADNWAARSSTAAGVNVRVHAKCTGEYEQDIDKALGLIESLWPPMVAMMGAPVPDQEGGTDEIDLYILEPLGSVWRGGAEHTIIEGAVAVAPSDAPYTGVRSSGFMLLGRDSLENGNIDSFKSTLAHEFFHILQNAHNQSISFHHVEDPGTHATSDPEWWFVEASAVWAETHFVRESSAFEAHWRYTFGFQDSDLSLHTSGEFPTPAQLHEYSAYIWPFFMEQEAGYQSIANAWRQIEQAGTDWDKGLAAIDAQLSFHDHFRRFAIRNLNRTFGADNPLGTRYVHLDPNFPDGVQPEIDDEAELNGAVSLTIPDSIPALRAHYYHYTIGPDVRQARFDFSNLQLAENRSVDAILKIRGRPWKLVTNLPDIVKYCRDNPDEDIEEIWFVVSNHATALATTVGGTIDVTSSTDPCGCNPAVLAAALQPEHWQGAVQLDYANAASDAQWSMRQARSASTSVVLGRQPDGPQSYLGSPVGEVHIDDVKIMRNGNLTSLFLSRIGTSQAVPYDSEHNYSRVTLNFRERDCTYNWRATFYVQATISSDGTPDRMEPVDIGSVQSAWMPIPEDLVLAGQQAFPAHSEEYIFDHGAPFYVQDDNELTTILGEDNQGVANVHWRFVPVP